MRSATRVGAFRTAAPIRAAGSPDGPGETQAGDAVQRAELILDLREDYLAAAAAMGTVNALPLVDLICENPVVTTRSIEERLGVSRPTALRLLRRMEEQGVLTEAQAGARGQRRYVARKLLAAVTEGSDG